MNRFSPNMLRYIIGISSRSDEIFMTMTLLSKSQEELNKKFSLKISSYHSDWLYSSQTCVGIPLGQIPRIHHIYSAIRGFFSAL